MELRVAGALAFGLTIPFAAAQGFMWRFDGATPEDRFGFDVAAAGDVDADGYGDVVVGSFFEDIPGSNAGAVRVFSGRTGALIWLARGDVANDELGRCVAGAGDVNGDGHADVIAGSALANGNRGYARVWSGRDGTLLHAFEGTNTFQRFGVSVGGGGDVDGDGHDDLLVGAYWAGYVRAFSGRTGAVIHHLTGPYGFGWSCAIAGDANGDGFADLVVGTDTGNFAQVFSGRDGSLLYHDGGQPGGNLGFCVSGAGDVDGDGLADVAFGSPATKEVKVFKFDPPGWLRVHWLWGGAAGDSFGWSVAGIGDVDGDGRDDLMVGAPLEDQAGMPDAGTARVYSGRTGEILATRAGDAPNDQFGCSGALADVDGDGFADLIVGSPLDENGVVNSGSAFVFDLGFAGTPARVQRLGAPCPGSNLHLPRIDCTARPFLGKTLALRLRGALPNTIAILNLGMPTNVDLGGFGMLGCTLFASADGFNLAVLTDQDGTAASPPVTVPLDPSLVGLAIAGQWICLDLLANPIGFTLSDMALLGFGN